MPIRWLKRLFSSKQDTGSSIQGVPNAAATAAQGEAPVRQAPIVVSAEATEILEGLILDVAPLASMRDTLTESIEIAKKTRSVEVFASRLQTATITLAMVEHHCQQHTTQLDGTDPARQAIDALITRGPPSTRSQPTKKSRNKAKTAPLASRAQAAKTMARPDVPVEFALSSWLSSSRTDETGTRTDKFWDDFRRDVQNGEYWADKSKQARANPRERLGIAMKMLPLPEAFRDAALAVRTLIREANKAKEPTDRLVELLYWLAAIASFGIPYAERTRQPGANVMEVASGAEIASLPFTYGELGYTRLDLLTATDRQTIVTAWGEPGEHSTLNELHPELWARYEDLAALAHDRRLKRLLDRI